jgi:hypothetical protein
MLGLKFISNKEFFMNKKMHVSEMLSTLWVVVMFTMIFADILSFITPGMMKQVIDGTTDVKITQPLLLIFAFLLQIPIVMIFLSKILNRKLNRIFNIVAAIITILFVIGGGSNYLHYYFFASVETISMIAIIIISIKWKENE